MAPRRSARNAPKAKPEMVEISSDSPSDHGDVDSQIEDQSVANKRKPEQNEGPSSPPNKNQKLPMRVKATTKTTPCGRRQSVSIEIPLPQSSARGKGKGKGKIFKEVKDSEEEDLEEGDANEVFKTPMERKPKHFKFDDDEHEEFVTPLERPTAKINASKDGRKIDDVVEDSEESDDEEEEEESDDEAPEAVSTNQAAAQAAKSAQAAAKAAEQ